MVSSVEALTALNTLKFSRFQISSVRAERFLENVSGKSKLNVKAVSEWSAAASNNDSNPKEYRCKTQFECSGTFEDRPEKVFIIAIEVVAHAHSSESLEPFFKNEDFLHGSIKSSYLYAQMHTIQLGQALGFNLKVMPEPRRESMQTTGPVVETPNPTTRQTTARKKARKTST